MTTDTDRNIDKNANKTSARNADARTDIQPTTPRENRDARNAGEDARIANANRLTKLRLARTDAMTALRCIYRARDLVGELDGPMADAWSQGLTRHTGVLVTFVTWAREQEAGRGDG